MESHDRKLWPMKRKRTTKKNSRAKFPSGLVILLSAFFPEIEAGGAKRKVGSFAGVTGFAVGHWGDASKREGPLLELNVRSCGRAVLRQLSTSPHTHTSSASIFGRKVLACAGPHERTTLIRNSNWKNSRTLVSRYSCGGLRSDLVSAQVVSGRAAHLSPIFLSRSFSAPTARKVNGNMSLVRTQKAVVRAANWSRGDF
jgi:hypothetical protein